MKSCNNIVKNKNKSSIRFNQKYNGKFDRRQILFKKKIFFKDYDTTYGMYQQQRVLQPSELSVHLPISSHYDPLARNSVLWIPASSESPSNLPYKLTH